ncbi:unnamed protein product [Prorocentrum cordatum]|uniref:Jacalin-type lectin domain-containing protein n=1 Tax=Prorocentrum cordatum TaxID=2364126 RepID=A0ABN9WQ96_9DINO|nr:unnamed protein product [Polarella glacialis]
MTADDKTCLVKVWGGGGPNGLPFDDSTEMVEINRLFSSLQVSQIKCGRHRWVDSIQLELGLGDTKWSLPEHGGKGGATDTLTFSEDQRIVAVDLRCERYIDNVSFWTDDGMEHVVGGPGGSYRGLWSSRRPSGTRPDASPRARGWWACTATPTSTWTPSASTWPRSNSTGRRKKSINRHVA